MSAAAMLILAGGGTLAAGIWAVSRKRKRCRAYPAAAQTFDLSAAVEAHMRRTGVSQAEAERLDHEFRRWFVVAAASPVMIGMGSLAVDEYWHTLLAVEDGTLYADFSEAVADRWIDHVEGVGSADLDAMAWVAYEAVWGEPPSDDFFPEPPEDLRAHYRAQASWSGGAPSDEGCCVSVSLSGRSGSHRGDNATYGGCAGGGGGGSCDGGGGASCGGGGGGCGSG